LFDVRPNPSNYQVGPNNITRASSNNNNTSNNVSIITNPTNITSSNSSGNGNNNNSNNKVGPLIAHSGKEKKFVVPIVDADDNYI
jgi:hypothetical protein